MRAPLLFATALALAACGETKTPQNGGDPLTVPSASPDPIATAAPTAAPSATTPPSAPQGVDRSSPQGVVDAYIAAAKAGDKKTMLDLFAPEARDREGTDRKAFTHAIADEGYKLLGVEERAPLKVTGDEASVRYRGNFRSPEGREKGDGMHFELKKRDGAWWIVTIQ